MKYVLLCESRRVSGKCIDKPYFVPAVCFGVLQQPTLSDMTMYEMNFSLLVEDTLKNIVLPEYRQIIVEVGGHPEIGRAHV